MALRLTSARGRGALIAAVAVLHVALVDRIAVSLAPMGSAAAGPARIQVAYVREMVPRPPSSVVAAPAVPMVREEVPRRAITRVFAGGNVGSAEPWSDAAIERSVRLDRPPPSVPPPSAAVAAAPPFDWPESTRLRYRLTGQYRGEVHGSAEVEWIRVGSRYQVHLDVTVGLPFAPLFGRRMSSDGTIGADGLHPRHYDEETSMAFREPRRAVVQLADDGVVLAHGRRVTRPPALQDSASQFVQIAFLLATRPELTAAGARVALPLALPRHVVDGVYEVRGTELVHADFGAVEALHLRPAQPPRPGDLSAEAWFAPTLRYLPARIRIRQDESTFIDLVLARLPELEVTGAATTAAAPR